VTQGSISGKCVCLQQKCKNTRHPQQSPRSRVIAVIGNQTLPLITLIDVDQKFHRSERRASLRTDVSKITGK
jgi:hypothetical protein